MFKLTNKQSEFKLGSFLAHEKEEQFTDLLKELKDVFAWSHKDMHKTYWAIAKDAIPFYLDAKPIKQKLFQIQPEWAL